MPPDLDAAASTVLANVCHHLVFFHCDHLNNLWGIWYYTDTNTFLLYLIHDYSRSIEVDLFQFSPLVQSVFSIETCLFSFPRGTFSKTKHRNISFDTLAGSAARPWNKHVFLSPYFWQNMIFFIFIQDWPWFGFFQETYIWFSELCLSENKFEPPANFAVSVHCWSTLN